MDIEKLRQEVIDARTKVIEIESEWREVKERYENAFNAWRKVARKLEDEDYKQALLDGRTKKIPMNYTEPKADNFSDEQKLEVLKSLGLLETKGE